MTKFRYSAIFAAAACLCWGQAVAQKQDNSAAPAIQSSAGYHLVVKFKNPHIHQALLSTPETRAQLEKLGSTVQAQAFAAQHHVNATAQNPSVFMEPLEQATGLALEHHRSASLGYDELTVQTDDAAAAIERLMATGQFVSVEPVYRMYPAVIETNDPMAKDQFYLNAYGPRFKSSAGFDALHAGFTNRLGRKVRFAILDTGSLEHDDVQFAAGYNFINAEVEPGRGRGVDASARYTKADGSVCQNEHGLGVASIVAATRNNGIGLVGAFPSEHAELVPVRVLGCTNGGGTVDIMEGLLWAAGGAVTGVPKISQRVDVANLSLGGFRGKAGCSQYEQEIINQVVQLGVTVIAAAGNENIPAAEQAPAACANVITVGALSNAGDKANFSNYGAAIDVVAEGNSVYQAAVTSDQKSVYSNGSGTSLAAPLVSALAGAMIAQEPTLTAAQIEARLKVTAIKNPAKNLNSNCNRYGCGAGLIQVRPAMGFAQPQYANSYAVKHRYEGFHSAADLAWMTALQPKAAACQTLQYTLGMAASKQPGVSYKIFISYSGGEPVQLSEVTLPQFIHPTPENAILSFRRCENGSCGDLVTMRKGNIKPPAVCQ